MQLEELRALFRKEGYQAEIEEATEVSARQLVILFGKDLFLRATLTEEQPLHLVQLFLLFPFPIEEEALQETARLILSINAGFDLASFGMYEGAKLLYYRSLYTFEGRLSEAALFAHVDGLRLLLETFMPSLEGVAKGVKTIEKFQEETKAALLAQEFELL